MKSKQAGQYDHALALVEKVLGTEKTDIGERREKMADMNYLAADLYKEVHQSHFFL